MLEVARQERAAARTRPAALAEREDALAREAPEVLLRPQDRAPEWVIAERCPVDQVLGDHRRLVLRAVDLLDHHAALAIELLCVYPRAPDEIAQQVDRRGRALGADGDVERHQIVARIRVQHATQPLSGLVDVLVGRVALAALEHKVLEEVRHPVLLWALVARARVERNQHRQRARAGQLDPVDRQAVHRDGARAHVRHICTLEPSRERPYADCAYRPLWARACTTLAQGRCPPSADSRSSPRLRWRSRSCSSWDCGSGDIPKTCPASCAPRSSTNTRCRFSTKRCSGSRMTTTDRSPRAS